MTNEFQGDSNPDKFRPLLQKNLGSRRITFFGNFGQKNLGNEATLWAILYNLRKAIPDAVMSCVCTGPEATLAAYNISAFPIHDVFVKPEFLQGNLVARLARKVFIGIPMEIYRWVQAIRALGKTDAFIVPGTQFLSDNLTGPWGWPYMAFRWSVAAKLRRCKILFVSVGVGPVHHPLSRFFVKFALGLADFRSYRDDLSREYVRSIGFNPDGDSVYPDLAFSLPTSPAPNEQYGPSKKPVVAVGIKDFHGQYRPSSLRLSGAEAYKCYIDRVTAFVGWLLERGYAVRLVIGDVLYDGQVLAELQEAIKLKNAHYHAGDIIVDPIHSFEDLISQLSTSDIIVSPRFHNIVFALLLNRPVLALSYHEKFSSLLPSSDLAKFNVAIEEADTATLTERFCELEKNRDELKRRIRENVNRYKAALDEQYRRILKFVIV